MTIVPLILRGTIITGAVATFVALSYVYPAFSSSEICARMDLECHVVTPFQPSAAQMEPVSAVHHVPDSTERTLAIDGIPFSRYWLLGDEQTYVFHPSKFGEYVLSNVKNESFRQNLPLLTARIAVDLPNGSLAFYYPNHYPLNRMRGPDLMYSAYGQASILQAYLRFHLLQDTGESLHLLKSVRDAMFFPYERGGVDLGVAQLELPLFRSNPEIILNGWLHALLVLANYAFVMDDRNVSDYVRRNLQFFAKYHKVWYDDDRNISRYSDTSPHRVTARVSSIDQSFWVIYRSKVTELKNYIVSPVVDLENEYSAFDVRINHLNTKNRLITMSITCSGLFDTLLVSDEPFGPLRIRGGGYDPVRATPSATGRWHNLKPHENGRYVCRLSFGEGRRVDMRIPDKFRQERRSQLLPFISSCSSHAIGDTLSL